MKVFIIGGTGFLGYYATLEFLRRGHEVTTMSIPDVQLGSWFPEKQVKVIYGDVFAMNEAELIKMFQNFADRAVSTQNSLFKINYNSAFKL